MKADEENLVSFAETVIEASIMNDDFDGSGVLQEAQDRGMVSHDNGIHRIKVATWSLYLATCEECQEVIYSHNRELWSHRWVSDGEHECLPFTTPAKGRDYAGDGSES